MSVHRAERILIRHLLDPEALETLMIEGFPLSAMPTEELREVVAWAMEYFMDAKMIEAPSLDALRLAHGPALTETEVAEGDPANKEGWSLGEPEDSLSWCVQTLKGGMVSKGATALAKQLARDLAEAPAEKKSAVFDQWVAEAVALNAEVNAASMVTDMRSGMGVREAEYHRRVHERGQFRGAGLGLDEVDEHIYGIHEGEVAVLGAPTKAGKSWLMNYCAIREFQRGRRVVLYTLENDIGMTQDRIACLATNVSPRRFQRGECTASEIKAISDFVKEMQAGNVPLWVLQPEPSRRTMGALTTEAAVLGAQTLLIDQLTHVERDREQPREDLIVRDQMHHLKRQSQRHGLSTIIAHQVSREGQKYADAEGRLRTWHLANGSEVERTADMVFGWYVSKDDRKARQGLFQIMASRREDIATWRLDFDLEACIIGVRRREVGE